MRQRGPTQTGKGGMEKTWKSLSKLSMRKPNEWLSPEMSLCHLGKIQISNFPMFAHSHFGMTLICAPQALPRNLETHIHQNMSFSDTLSVLSEQSYKSQKRKICIIWDEERVTFWCPFHRVTSIGWLSYEIIHSTSLAIKKCYLFSISVYSLL